MTIRWEIVSEEFAEKNWDDNLEKISDFSYTQLYNWGEHRKSFGWQPYRWMVNDDEKLVGMVQGLVKRKAFGVVALWIFGAPMKNVNVFNHNFRAQLQTDLDARFIYERIYFNKSFNDNQVEDYDECAKILVSNGWKQPSTKIRSGQSMMLDLRKSEDELRSQLSKNWRKTLKRAENKGVVVTEWEQPDIGEMHKTYSSMQELKGIPEQFSYDELHSIFKHLGDKIKMLQCRNHAGKLIAFRGYIYHKELAWDLFAAADIEARNISATYVLFWNLLLMCKNQCVKKYDLAGIDMKNNIGVYNFKKGTGAERIQYLGDWEWSNFFLLPPAINYIIKKSSQYEI